MKRKLLSLLLISCCLIGASACSLPFGGSDFVSVSFTEEEKKAAVELTAEDKVAIRVLKTNGEESLLSVMQALQADGGLTFTESGGMVTSINGKENPADWSYCWMLYTSDKETSNTEWGELDYNGAKLGSAVLGADALPVVEGELYVWYYQGV